MRIFVLGQVFEHNQQHYGSFNIARIIGKYSSHHVDLYANLSLESTQLKPFIRDLHKDGVSTDTMPKIPTSPQYVNDFEVLKSSGKWHKRMKQYDLIVIATDTHHKDMKKLIHIANKLNIDTIIFTQYETEITSTIGHTVQVEEVDDYSESVKYQLLKRNVINEAHIKRTFKTRPRSKVFKITKFIGQLIAFSLIILIISLLVYRLLNTTQNENFETNINWESNTGHECGTVESCKIAGDELLNELAQYIDLGAEPHIFVENRSRNIYVEYDVQNFELTNRNVKADIPVGEREDYEVIWNQFVSFFPREYTRKVNQFQLFSDGEGNTLAYVNIKTEGITLGIDIRDNQAKGPLYRTLIHEFGHIYSLPIEDFTEACTTPEIDCLKPGTLLHQYTERFWSQYGESWYENRGKSQPEQRAFYNNNFEDFSVPYQAMNVKEDYAISFTNFIIQKMPTSDALKDVKVRSMYENEELVAMRVEILENILDYEKNISNNG